MSKRKRYNTDFKIHFVTFTVRNFIPIFKNKDIANTLVKILQFYSDKKIYTLHAYVIMPDHVHILLERLNDKSISSIVQNIKKYFTYKYKNRSIVSDKFIIKDGKFRLWQTGFDEVTIYSEKQYRIKYEYILNNPVKSGMVKKAEEYKWSSVVGDHLGRENIPYINDALLQGMICDWDKYLKEEKEKRKDRVIEKA
ncbi:MAG: transposase [candidate division Zixibacteria bacterium]|nr:transposase [candidate division Zixibacteria bacterium]